MNRNSIRTRVRVASCCIAGVMVISGSSFVSNAAVTAGVSNLASITAETTTEGVNPSAGVSLSLAQYLTDTTDENAGAGEVQTETGAGEAQAEEAQAAENEAPVVKSEFADIGVSNVDEESYINIRSAADAESEVVGKLYSSSAVTVLGTEGEWYQIHSGNCEGYIKCEYIITGDDELAKSISTRVAIVNTENLNIRDDMSTEGTVLGQVGTGDSLIVTEEMDGWVKVSTEEGEGYVSSDYVSCENHYKVAETREEEEERLRREEEARMAAAEEEARRARASQSQSSGRSSSSSNGDIGAARTYNPPAGGSGQAVVDYACQFVGNPYVYGGSSLTNGADCSGFVMAVYAAFGVSLPHSSTAMRGVGYEVSPAAMQPGDIICYDGHVAIYVGGDTIVHASTPTTGIKYSSPAAYRTIITVRRIF